MSYVDAVNDKSNDKIHVVERNLDGERELTFSEVDAVGIRLQTDAFRTINVLDCMAYAAKHGLLTRGVKNGLRAAQ